MRYKPSFLVGRLLARLTLVFLSCLIGLIICEVLLRAKGYYPGYVPRFSNPGFRPVEKLEVSNQYLTDGEGIFRANPDAEWPPEYSINASGFRSQAFQNPTDGRPSILLLGDSFAWGASAKPITNGFADILRRSGFHVFNTGIPATDLKQYAYLAEKYILILEPDVVAVALYMGNDIRRYRPMLPYKNMCHVTNVGWIQAFTADGEWMSPQTAYTRRLIDSNLANPYLYDSRKTWKALIKRVFTNSAAGTLLLVRAGSARDLLSAASIRRRTVRDVLPISQPVQVDSTASSDEDLRMGIMREARTYLKTIRSVSHERSSGFLLFIIPEHRETVLPEQTLEGNRVVFDDFKILAPADLTEADYEPPPDKHFNNRGHRKFARFMLAQIQTIADRATKSGENELLQMSLQNNGE